MPSCFPIALSTATSDYHTTSSAGHSNKRAVISQTPLPTNVILSALIGPKASFSSSHAPSPIQESPKSSDLHQLILYKANIKPRLIHDGKSPDQYGDRPLPALSLWKAIHVLTFTHPVNPFTKRESHNKRSLLAYRFLTSSTWLLLVVLSVYYSLYAPSNGRTIWDQSKAHPTAYSLNPEIVSVYWYTSLPTLSNDPNPLHASQNPKS